MIEIVNFKAEHWEQIVEQKNQLYIRKCFSKRQAELLEKSETAFTGVAASGKVVFCAGVNKYWEGRGEAWAILAQSCRKEFLAIHNAVKRYLDVCPLRRIEAAVDVNFKAGHRWVKALGFELEAPRLKAYQPDGVDCALYSRVRDF